MQSLIDALNRRFDTLSQSSMLETFIPSLYQYVSLIMENAYFLPLIQKLENKEMSDTQERQGRHLQFLKETEIWPHWKKIKACINIAGKSHNEAAALFSKKQDLSVLDFLHFRAGNNSLRGAPTHKQIQSYQTSAAIVHHYLIEQIEAMQSELAIAKPQGLAENIVRKQNQTAEKSNKIIVRMNGRKWSGTSIYVHENGDVRIKFQDGETHETDWQELGLTKTREGKLVGSVNWNFLYTCAMYNGRYPLKELSKSEQSKAQQWKKSVKIALMERLNTHEDPFSFDNAKQEYITRFQISPAPKDRESIYSPRGIISDVGEGTNDWEKQMAEDTRRH